MTPAYSYGKTLLTIENVSKEYKTLVLDKVHAEIKDIVVPGEIKGQVVVFVGPSGIGKSTLTRIMAGLEAPTSGRVTINGFDRPVRAGEVGMVAQNYPLFNHRTVFANLMLAARQTSKTKEEAKKRVNEYLDEFKLTAQAKCWPAQLSGGQRQRIAIIQQILCSEHFILMDEPFSGLDPVMKKKAAETIREIANRDDLNTIIIVTHDIAAGCSVADTVWMMGRDRDTAGNIIPGASIVETYNLIDMGLAWVQNVASTFAFSQFIVKLTERFETL